MENSAEGETQKSAEEEILNQFKRNLKSENVEGEICSLREKRGLGFSRFFVLFFFFTFFCKYLQGPHFEKCFARNPLIPGLWEACGPHPEPCRMHPHGTLIYENMRINSTLFKGSGYQGNAQVNFITNNIIPFIFSQWRKWSQWWTKISYR